MAPSRMQGEIEFVHVKGDMTKKSASCTSVARSHVMRRAHRRSHLAADFRLVTVDQMQRRNAERENCEKHAKESPRSLLAADKLDPFDTFAVDTSELAALLDNPKARQAGEPVINFNEQMGFQSLRTIFGSSIADPALLNALFMTLAFAVTSDSGNTKYLTYRGNALRYINERLQEASRSVSSATIGAILLLIGVEARLGSKENVEPHLKGISQILGLCDSQNAWLGDGIKRAIFWQDMFSALFTGSWRILTHESFAELSWKRDSLRPSIYQTPVGFQMFQSALGNEFLDITADIKALQIMTDARIVDCQDAVSVMHLDNHQASVESRLQILGRDPMRFVNPGLYCCICTSHLCAYTLYTDIWSSSLIPEHMAWYVLEHLESVFDVQWPLEDYWPLLLWIVSLCGAFAAPGHVQDAYARMLDQLVSRKPEVYHQVGLVEVLQGFVWSERAFGKPWYAFKSHMETMVGLDRIRI